jgi:hypothetical protein
LQVFNDMGQTKLEYDKTQGQTSQLPCAACNAQTYHLVAKSVDIEMGLLSVNSYEHFQIIQCQGCRSFSFCKVSKITDFEGAKGLRPTLKTRRDLYPPRVPGHKLIAESFLPESVSQVYAETYKALCNEQPVLAGIGVRALIEAVCQERNATGKTLEQKIDGLVNLNLLTSDSAKFLHNLRVIGNQAAHKVKPHSEEKLSAAMKIIEHLLEAVYVIPKYGNKLSKP